MVIFIMAEITRPEEVEWLVGNGGECMVHDAGAVWKEKTLVGH